VKLITAPNEILSKPVQLFDFKKMDAKGISDDMIALMQSKGGIGLSANQVGIDAQILVMKLHLLYSKETITIINPQIEALSADTETMPEGCLSHDGLILDIKRPVSVVVKYLDTDEKPCTITLYDIDARCFLHEYDHLCGIEFTDRVSALKLTRARDRIKKQMKRMKTHG